MTDTTGAHTNTPDSVMLKPDNIPDSKDSLKVYSFLLKEYLSENHDFILIDTTLEYSQQQDPAFSGNNFYQTLGNQGLATKNLLFSPNDPIIYDYGIHSFSLYQTTSDNINVFSSYKPYTILDYAQGPSGDKREAQLNVDHGQYLAKNLGVGAKLYMNNSMGDYHRQKADNFQLAFYGHFKTESERYAATAAYINNKTTWYDNGGIKYDSIFEQNIEPGRKLIEVNNTKSETEIKDIWLHASQYFYILSPALNTLSLGKIGLDTDYNRTKYQYWDSNPDPSYYPAFYGPDSTNTFDSTTVSRLINNLYWMSSKSGKRQILNLKGGIIIQNNNVHHHDSVSFSSHWFTTYGEVFLNPDSTTDIWGKIALTAGTHSTENFLLEGKASRNFSFGKLSAHIKAFNADPGFLLLKHHSSHYSWDSSAFKDIANLETGVKYRYKKTDAGIQYNTIGNYTYLNQDVLPMQNPGAIHLLRAWVSQELSLWKFDIAAKGVYQFVSNSDVIRLPQFMGKMSFQFYQPMFKNALYTRVGFDVLYTTEFYADSYCPALREFHLQDEKRTGNYPYVDAYIKLQVKRARIFLMLTHVNSGLMGYNYYMTPHYPMKDRYFKYGVSWFFHD